MTYYEELGVASSAPAHEIRQAYRVLARLVHPDGQVDERVRGMAERQMQRLNEILETLLDARRRREYDDSLLRPEVAPAASLTAKFRPPKGRFHPPPPAPRRSVPKWANAMVINWFRVAPAAVILGMGCWYVGVGGGPRAAAVGAPRRVSQPAPDARGQRARRDIRSASQSPAPIAGTQQREPVQSSPAPAQPEPASAAAPSGQSVPPSLAALPAPPEFEPPAAALAAPASPDPASAPAPPALPAPPTLAGAWLYVPGSADVPAPGVYPPTYVEFLLTEEHGQLTGSYRARYRIPDRALSAEVAFRAQGKPLDPESAKLGWTSADGARGEVEVRLRGPNAMSLTWWTTEFGRRPSLASGTAVLLRQQSP